ncbi:MAG: HTH domain-containing protein [Planctomycetales bacterium]
MGNDLPWREAIDRVLKEAGAALHYTDIADRIVSAKLRKSVGATPAATVNAFITTTIKQQVDKAPFVRVGRGEYISRSLATSHVPIAAMDDEQEGSEKQYEVITSFGMFWRRDLISWSKIPRLLGMQQIGATPVDFCLQQGLYLLYDGREVIYVGRSTERPLGRRLYEHTFDRLSTRWDRFSWFGLLPVSDDGQLESLPPQYLSDKIIPAMEAVLIEALEPRQNRKRGDDLAAVEYIQKEDPEIRKKLLKDTIESVLAKA